MTRDLLPPVMGGIVAFGVAAAVAEFPGSHPVVSGVSGVAVGLLAAAAFRALPRHLDMNGPVPGEDDGSGERPVWSSRETEQLAPHNAWRFDADERGFVTSDTAEIPAPAVPAVEEKTVIYDTRWLQLRRPKGKRRATRAGAR